MGLRGEFVSQGAKCRHSRASNQTSVLAKLDKLYTGMILRFPLPLLLLLLLFPRLSYVKPSMSPQSQDCVKGMGIWGIIDRGRMQAAQ